MLVAVHSGSPITLGYRLGVALISTLWLRPFMAVLAFPLNAFSNGDATCQCNVSSYTNEDCTRMALSVKIKCPDQTKHSWYGVQLKRVTGGRSYTCNCVLPRFRSQILWNLLLWMVCGRFEFETDFFVFASQPPPNCPSHICHLLTKPHPFQRSHCNTK